MPVEIKELVIRARVEPGAGDEDVDGGCGGAAPSSEAQAAVVEAAVREVLRILKTRKER